MAALARAAGEVLSVPALQRDVEAVAANWNQGLEDAGAQPFEGRLLPVGCDPVGVAGALAGWPTPLA